MVGGVAGVTVDGVRTLSHGLLDRYGHPLAARGRNGGLHAGIRRCVMVANDRGRGCGRREVTVARGFDPPGVAKPFGIFSNAAFEPEGARLHVSGQVAFDADGDIVGIGDIRAQTRQVLDNVRTILAAAGGTMADIVQVVVYVTDMRHLAAIHEVRAEYFEPPYPASTLVQVSALVRPELLVEISAIAVIPEDRVKRP